MPATKKAKKQPEPFANQQFIGKAIKDGPPDTFPLIPIGKDDCSHSNKKWIVAKNGWNCLDCGFFVPKIKEAEKVIVEGKPHIAVQVEPVTIKVPDLPDNYQLIELPRASFDVTGELFVKENGFLGELDKKKIAIFSNYLRKGYKIKSVQLTNANTFLFFMEK